jgi:transcriptional regulator with XRE-family HTH domain
MSDRDTFGPRLRAERERRGISLDTLASVTKVGADLWEGLERNDFSRWPSGIFARSFVRDYARAVGLDADEVVNEFCRLFPIGDRRANRQMKAQAELIGHKLAYMEPGGVPAQGDRRTGPADDDNLDDAMRRRPRLAPRSLAAVIDTAITLAVSSVPPFLFHAGFGSSVAVVALLYYAGATILLATTPGNWVVSALRPRVPFLFTMSDRRRAHA